MVGWFLVLVVGGALLAPVAVLLARIVGGRSARWIAGVGIAAAIVQVVGLSRWALFVPRLSDDATVPARAADARHTFELLHTWLGTILGETIGYALTATFTVLVAVAVHTTVVPRWLALVGLASAALIATGVVIPLGVPGAALTNFAGYLAWCLWLIAMAVALVRSTTPQHAGDRVAA